MKNIAVIDDNINDSQRLASLLIELDSALNIQTFTSVDSFTESALRTELSFLDIDLNGKNGINEKKKLNPFTRFIVYTTNLKERMQSAFDENVVGFLVKSDPNEIIKEQLGSIFQKYLYASITFRTDTGKLPVFISDIYYVSRENRKIYVHLKSISIRIYGYTLNEIYNLSSDTMIWIDRSIMVNAKHIHTISLSKITLDNERILYITARRKNQFLLDYTKNNNVMHFRHSVNHSDILPCFRKITSIRFV